MFRSALKAQHNDTSMNPVSSAGQTAANTQWDKLKLKGRRLEKQLYDKLERIGSEEVTRAIFDTTSEEIQQLLAKLKALLRDMEKYIESGKPGGQTRVHTKDRYESILRDYSSEFARTKARVSGELIRMELLGNVGRKRDDDLENGTAALIDEQTSLKASLGIADESIMTAQETREGLKRQRTIFQSSRLNAQKLASMIPDVRGLMRRIARFKQRDTIVVALVIAVCVFLMMVYWWNK